MISVMFDLIKTHFIADPTEVAQLKSPWISHLVGGSPQFIEQGLTMLSARWRTDGFCVEEGGLSVWALETFPEGYREAGFVSEQCSSQILCHGVGTGSPGFSSCSTAVILCLGHPSLLFPSLF